MQINGLVRPVSRIYGVRAFDACRDEIVLASNLSLSRHFQASNWSNLVLLVKSCRVRSEFRDNRNRLENQSLWNFFQDYRLTKTPKTRTIFFRFRLSRNSHQTRGLDHCKTLSGLASRRQLISRQQSALGNLPEKKQAKKERRPIAKVSKLYHQNERMYTSRRTLRTT
jgi:hypothetical protein